MVRRGAICAVLACALGCQGSGSSSAPPPAVARDATAIDAAEPLGEHVDHGPPEKGPPDKGPPDRGAKDTPTKPDEPEAPDPGKLIDSLGAIPAWQAVIDRANLLGRRKQHGVVYGTVGGVVVLLAPGQAGFGDEPAPVGSAGGSAAPAAAGIGSAVGTSLGSASASATTTSPYVWLVDDSDGNGALAIRVELGTKGATVKLGDRVALGGAWELDNEHRWFWKVDSLQALPPAAPSDVKDPPPAHVGHVIANGELPPGARTASVARDDDAIYFQIVAPYPTDDADGWAIADQLGNPPTAILSLPGEHAIYGGQDMRAADERWTLKRGQTYWVRIGKLHKHGADKPMTINARTPPVRVL